jgi:SHS2 domain-containing protein
METFEILDHTADLSLRAYGRDLRELTENAARGLLALLYAADPPAPQQTRELTVSAEQPEYVIQRALRELLYLLEDSGEAPVAVAVATAGRGEARLRVGTVPLEQVRSLLGAEIKAVTRHGLAIAQGPEGLSLTLVLDV